MKCYKLLCTGYAPICLPVLPIHLSFEDYLVATDHTLHWLLEHFDFMDASAICQEVTDKDALAVSDGSFQSTYGTVSLYHQLQSLEQCYCTR
jgi:hypothetical protein